MKKKYIPYVVGLPNMSVGILWAMNLVLIPMLAGTITQSNAQLGYLVSMGAFTGIFVQYLAGILSDRSNFKIGKRKPFILMGVIFSTIFICLMPFARSYSTLFIVAFIFYFSLNFFQGPYYSLIPEQVDENQLGLANGFSKIISVLGSGLILFTGPMLWEKSHSLPFFMAAFLGLITVLIGISLIHEKTANLNKPSKISFDFVKYPAVMKLYFCVFFVYLSYGCITPFFVKYCSVQLHFSQGTASTGLLLLTLVGAIFAYPIGVLSDRIERRKVLLIGVLIFAISLLAAVFIKNIEEMYSVLSLIGIGFIAIQITIYSILAEIVPPERLGEFMGFINLFISLAQFIANNAMGFALDKVGFSYFFPISSTLMFVAVIIIFFSRFSKYKNSHSFNEVQ